MSGRLGKDIGKVTNLTWHNETSRRRESTQDA